MKNCKKGGGGGGEIMVQVQVLLKGVAGTFLI